jgi:pimeloyl-ACP methyl ester carboxylesterase
LKEGFVHFEMRFFIDILTYFVLGRTPIWGEDDHFGSVETARQAVRCLPKANYTAVPGGHLPWLDAPDQVAGLIREFTQ